MVIYLGHNIVNATKMIIRYNYFATKVNKIKRKCPLRKLKYSVLVQAFLSKRCGFALISCVGGCSGDHDDVGDDVLNLTNMILLLMVHSICDFRIMVSLIHCLLALSAM